MADRPKHILMIVENLPVPFDKRVWNEATSLARAGYGVTVICPTGRGFERRHEELDGVTIFRHPLPKEGEGPLGYAFEYGAALLWQLVLSFRVLLRQGCDAVHACNPPDTIFLIGLLLKPFGVRFVFDHHDITPELYIAKFGRKDLLYRLMLLLERLTFRTADIPIATNESYREIAITRGKMAPDRVFVVRSGPNLATFRPVSADPRLKHGRRHLVGYVGVMGKQEGLHYLLEAARIIVQEKGNTDIQFVLIGGGTEFEALKSLAVEKGVAEYVRFTGRIPDDKMLSYLSSADVCINPDSATELNDKSTMNKIMEYMALGKPVVQFDLTEGRRSALEASLYARRNDSADLAEKILFLLGQPALRKTMGEYGQRRVRDELAWEYCERVLLRAYESLFGPAPGHVLVDRKN